MLQSQSPTFDPEMATNFPFLPSLASVNPDGPPGVGLRWSWAEMKNRELTSPRILWSSTFLRRLLSSLVCLSTTWTLKTMPKGHDQPYSSHHLLNFEFSFPFEVPFPSSYWDEARQIHRYHSIRAHHPNTPLENLAHKNFGYKTGSFYSFSSRKSALSPPSRPQIAGCWWGRTWGLEIICSVLRWRKSFFCCSSVACHRTKSHSQQSRWAGTRSLEAKI